LSNTKKNLPKGQLILLLVRSPAVRLTDSVMYYLQLQLLFLRKYMTE